MARVPFNRLLESLPAVDRDALLSVLKPVDLPLRTPLFKSGSPPRYVHFLTSGLASTVNNTSDRTGVEVAVATRDGFPEALHLLGPHQGDNMCFMQLEGSALRMEFKVFQREFQRNETLRILVLAYVQAESLVTAQVVVCNVLHTAEQRLVRWLLMVSDRLGIPTIGLTQEFLAGMIGSRRSTVSIAAGELQRHGMIEYKRGIIEIVDRKAMENAACDCYPVTRRLHTQLYR